MSSCGGPKGAPHAQSPFPRFPRRAPGATRSGPTPSDRHADRVSLGNCEFAGFLTGAASGGFIGTALEDPVAIVLGAVFGAAVGAAIAAALFRGRVRQARRRG